MLFRTLALLVLVAPTAARAQTCYSGQCYRPAVVYRYSPPPSAAPRVVYAQPQVSQVAIQPAPVAQVQATTQTAGDPYGFVLWLNSYRSARGLGAVIHDPALDAIAAVNNGLQAVRGLGHHYHTTLRQNAGMGAYATVVTAWTTSGGHEVALSDPRVTRVGIAGDGNFWTYVGN